MGDPNQSTKQPARASLGLFDSVNIIIGIVIGASIFEVPNLIFARVANPYWGLFAWVLGGALALIGALCYAELTTTYPRSGGDYVYQTRAFGPLTGFLFGWAQLVVILTASIGSMSFVFAKQADALFFPPGKVELDTSLPEAEAKKKLSETQADQKRRSELRAAGLAVGAVSVLSLLNLLGVVFGKLTQNILTVVKVLGLGGIIVVGFWFGLPAHLHTPDTTVPEKDLSFAFAMILVLYAYGGWNDAAFVASEVKNRRRNLPLALILGVLSIMAIYLLVNAAYVMALGFKGVQDFGVPARTLGETLTGVTVGGFDVGENASKVMRVLIMISALGAVNGLIFTGSRVYSSLGAEHSVFALLGRWHPRLGSPHWSLLIQWIIVIGMILSVGTFFGREAIDALVTTGGYLNPIPWDKYFGGFDTLVAATAPVFWLFFLLTGLALFKLRDRDKNLERPFTVPFYPFLPFIFCLMCAWMLYASIAYAEWLCLIFAAPVFVGIPLYFFSKQNISLATKPEELHAAEEADT